MKTLLILRHGKAKARADSGRDRDRPLKARGREDVGTVARELQRRGLAPQAVLTSTALRALETTEAALAAGGWGVEARGEERLYHANQGTGLALLRSQPDHVDTLLVSAHEPMCSDLTRALSGAPLAGFPTGAVAILDCEVESWRELAVGACTLRALLTPREVAARTTDAGERRFPSLVPGDGASS